MPEKSEKLNPSTQSGDQELNLFRKLSAAVLLKRAKKLQASHQRRLEGLIPRATVKTAIEGRIQKLHNNLARVPAELAQELTGMTEGYEIDHATDAYFRRLCGVNEA